MLSRFHLVPERNGRADRQTDGRTDRFSMSISRVSMLTHDKNRTQVFEWYQFELPRVTSNPDFKVTV